MRLILPKDVFLWLTDSYILSHPSKEQTPEGCVVSYDDTIYFQNGYKIGTILKLLEQEYRLGLMGLSKIRKITVLHENDNWIIVKKAFDKLGMGFQELEMSSFKENPQVLAKIISTLYKDFYLTRKHIHRSFTTAEEEFSLQTFDPSKQPSDATTTLQFMCIILCKTFGIKVQESLGMLINESSLLARTIILGTSSQSHLKVEEMYDSILERAEPFGFLLKQETQNVKFVMNALRCGLFSRSLEVAEKCLQLIKKAELRQWLVGTDKCKSMFLGLQRHPQLSDHFFSLVSCFYGSNLVIFLKEEFTDGFKKNTEFMSCARELIVYMRSSLYRKEFLESKILEEWLQVVFEALEDENADTNSRIVTINFLTEILLTEDLLRNLRYAIPLKRIFQNIEVDQGTLCQKLSLCNNIFRLLSHSVEKKHETNVKLFYNTLCDLLAKCRSEEIRQFIMNNIRLFLTKYNKMPLGTFLPCLHSKDIIQSTEIELFRMLASRCEPQEIEPIGDILLNTFQEGIERQVFGEIVIELIKHHYDYSEELIIKSIKSLLGIYTSLLKTPLYKSKRAINLSNKKGKSLDKIFYTQNEQQELIRLQHASNAVALLIKLLGLLKPKHSELARVILESAKADLKKKKVSEESLDRFTRVLDKREKVEISNQLLFPDEPTHMSYVNSVHHSMSVTFINKLSDPNLKTSEVGIKEQENEGQEDMTESKVISQKSEIGESGGFSLGSSESIVVDSPVHEEKERNTVHVGKPEDDLVEGKVELQQLNFQQHPSNLQELNPKLEEIEVVQNQSKEQQKQIPHPHKLAFSEVEPAEEAKTPSVTPQQPEEDSRLRDFTEEAPEEIRYTSFDDLQDHELTYISHIKQVNKVIFEYLMLLTHQEGIDKLNCTYKLNNLLGEERWRVASEELLSIPNISVGEFSQVMIMHSLHLCKGVNRMKGINKMLQHFKAETKSQKGNIKVLDDKDSVERVVELRDGFRRSKLRSIHYKEQPKCKGIADKHLICYEIVNEMIRNRFGASSIEEMMTVEDTIAAEELHTEKKKPEKVVSQRTAVDVDRERKDKVVARIKALEKQVNTNKK